MRIKTSRISPEALAGAEYAYPSFANGKPFSEKKTGRLPAMGWNSWNAFGSGNTEALTKQMAEKIIELGLDKYGYQYLVLDDGCYCPERKDGRLVNEPVKFPSGFRALADFMHERGLKFGMYNDIGTNLCAGAAVGTCGFEDLDAKSYADWNIDFLKVDNCYYLWDNATFSNGENARFSFAPKISSIKITCSEKGFSAEIPTDKAVLKGQGGHIENGVASFIGTFDGTNVGTTPVGERSAELCFEFDVPEDGEYDVSVLYATSRENGQGEWLQMAADGQVKTGNAESLFVEGRTLVFDGLLTPSPDKDTFVWSEPVRLSLKKGIERVYLFNHRRQENTLNSYAAMFYALREAGAEDVVLSICEWGKTQPQNWGYKVGNSWRILNDITFCVGRDGDPGRGSWDEPGTQSIASQYNKAVVMDEFAGLDRGWNDPDMMVIGMNGITTQMSETHMVMWCMMNSPLMLGMDLRRIQKDDELYRIITNEDLIALNRDALGIQAKRVYSTLIKEAPDTTYITNNDRVDILAKPLSDGSFALSFINLSREKKSEGYEISIDRILELLGNKMTNADKLDKASAFAMKDLITKEETTVQGRCFKVAELEPEGHRTYRITAI